MGFPDGIDISHPSRLDRLRVAFAAQVAKDIADADGVLDLDEMKLLMKVFPDALMRACQFLDDQGAWTPLFHTTRIEAARMLQIELGLALKLELVTMFHHVAFADGDTHELELEVLLQAASTLGVTRTQLQRHLEILQGRITPVAPPRRSVEG